MKKSDNTTRRHKFDKSVEMEYATKKDIVLQKKVIMIYYKKKFAIFASRGY